MPVPGGLANRSFLVPIVALGSTLLALVVAIGIVMVRGNGDDGRPRGPAGAAASPSPASSDPGDGRTCLVGGWRVTSHTEEVDVPGIGELQFTGAGSELSLGADGTGIVDYGAGTSYRGGYAGQDVVLEVRGTVSYRYRAAADRIELTDVRSGAEVRLQVGAGPPGPWQHFTASAEPFGYTCVGSTMTQTALVYTTSYLRSD